MVKNNFYKVSGLILSVSLIIPLFTSAQSDTNLTSQIQSLMSQITSLEQQLHTLVQTSVGSSTISGWGESYANASTTPPRTGGPGSVACPMIARDLSMGSRGADVSSLQSLLSGDGYLSATSTGFFGPMTARALAQFQKAMGLATSTGVFGSLTRNYLAGHCGGSGNGDDGHTGSTTPPLFWTTPHATSTTRNSDGQNTWSGNSPASTTSGIPCLTPYAPPSDSSGQGAAHTNIIIMRPCDGGGMTPPSGKFMPMGSSTPPAPCPQSSIQNGSDFAAVEAALFRPHAILPAAGDSPCNNDSANGDQSPVGGGGYGN